MTLASAVVTIGGKRRRRNWLLQRRRTGEEVVGVLVNPVAHEGEQLVGVAAVAHPRPWVVVGQVALAEPLNDLVNHRGADQLVERGVAGVLVQRQGVVGEHLRRRPR